MVTQAAELVKCIKKFRYRMRRCIWYTPADPQSFIIDNLSHSGQKLKEVTE
jgi:hypothetical protein